MTKPDANVVSASTCYQIPMHHPQSIHYPGFVLKMGICDSSGEIKPLANYNDDNNNSSNDIDNINEDDMNNRINNNNNHNNNNNNNNNNNHGKVRHESDDYYYLGYCDEAEKEPFRNNSNDVFIPTSPQQDSNMYTNNNHSGDCNNDYSDYDIVELNGSGEEWTNGQCNDIPSYDHHRIPEVIVTECCNGADGNSARCVRFSENDQHHHYECQHHHDNNYNHTEHQGNNQYNESMEQHLGMTLHNNQLNGPQDGHGRYLDGLSSTTSLESFMSGLSSATNTTSNSEFYDDMTPTKLQIYLKYSQKNWCLTVGVKQAECPINPHKKDRRVYWQVSMTLLPFKRQRRKTRYKSTSTPIFNEEFVLEEIPKQALSQMSVRYRVYGRYGRTGRKRLAGQCEVELGNLLYKQDNSVYEWRTLHKGGLVEDEQESIGHSDIECE